ERMRIINWLSPINFFLRHADISRVRQKHTGGWLLADPVFKRWESGSGRTLWCRGIPGAGKTMLASMVVDHLSAEYADRNVGVACIYLTHKEADTQTPVSLLSGLWRQLVIGQDVGISAKRLYRQHHEKGTTPSLGESSEVLTSIIEHYSRVFIVVDAVDEYPELQRRILLQYLTAIQPVVKLMITSRPHISFDSLALSNVEILHVSAKTEDIREYVNTQIDLFPRLSKHIQRQSELRGEIHAAITDAADGMFLLARLHIESLSTKNTIKAVREALKVLPNNLRDSYDIAMLRIEAQTEEDRKITHSTLAWVANAKRPLKVADITVALAIEPGAQQLDEDNFLDIDIILAVCAGLVIVDEQLSVVRLVHYTTQEYLDS
ncbi:hypothetical protein B0H19DRAFT_861021, partial [Mycena capillaripes]